MSRRMFVQISRGMTDKTMACIFPWEKPVLELVHGEVVADVTIDQMCDMGKPLTIERQRLNHSENYAPDLRAQLEAMVLVPPNEDPVLDPAREYNRVAEKYGMDREFPIPCIERIYGQLGSGAFTAKVNEFHAESVRLDKEEGRAGKVLSPGKAMEKSPDLMSVADLRDRLTHFNVRFDPQLTKAELVELYKQTAGAARKAA